MTKRLPRCEREKTEFEKRVTALYRESKPELLAEFGRLRRVHCANMKTSKGDLVSGILSAEGWF